MGKIGSFEYPDLNVSEAIRITETLVKDFQSKATDLDNFAKAIGHKTYNSGAFYNKLADMRKYGLMDKREVEATPLAEIIAHPKDNAERQEAINKMISNIALFERLKERLKTKNPALEQFKTQLIEVSQDRNKGSKEAEKIRKIYIEALSHTNENVETSKDNRGSSQRNPRQKGNLGEDMINANIEDVYIEMPRTLEAVEIAKQMINILETKIKSSKKELGEE
jgi:hypothetical protein